jgi:hypothetical protein
MNVPVDDTHHNLYIIAWSETGGVDQEAWRKFTGMQLGIDLDPEYRKINNRSNNYGQDRAAMRNGKNFTGIKGEVNGGVTTYGDNRNYRVALAWGTGFAAGRGHILLSGEIAREDGIYDPSNRDWTKAGWAFINNSAYTATNGQPRVLLRPGVGLSTSTLGGAIACSATAACSLLRGVAFGPGGSPYNLVFGPVVSDPLMAGGTLADNNLRNGVDNSLLPRQDRRNIFGRHLLTQVALSARTKRSEFGIGHSDLLLNRRDLSVLQPRSQLEFASSCRRLTLIPLLLQQRAGLATGRMHRLLLLPDNLLGGRCGAQIGNLMLCCLKAIMRGLVVLVPQRLALNLQRDQPPLQIVDLARHALRLHLHPGRSLIHEIDGLVRQETVGDVAVR